MAVSVLLLLGLLHTTAADSDSAAVAATIDRFHAALAAGDSTAALDLMSDDVLILEAGGLETKSEYRAHHLSGDMEFARAVTSDRASRSIRVQGDVAWAVATSSTKGTFRERAIDSLGAELIVLQKLKDEWQIVAIHWSSRARRRS